MAPKIMAERNNHLDSVISIKNVSPDLQKARFNGSVTIKNHCFYL